jgi:hypothetical protein
MIVSVINLTTGKLTDEAIQSAIRAVNRQINEDFIPYWGFGGQLRLEGKSNRKRSNATSDMRGDAVLYLCGDVKNSGVDGYHDKTYRGIPYGVVYLELAQLLNEAWTVTLSHEALELIGDPESNLLVQGPHPRFPQRSVFHWFEMCDAVQDEQYELDGIAVSNFVLPLYFTSSAEHGGRNDFLGTTVAGKNLRSFGVNPGGAPAHQDTSEDRPRGVAKTTHPAEAQKLAERSTECCRYTVPTAIPRPRTPSPARSRPPPA